MNLQINPKTGYIDTIKVVPSPNYDQRPADTVIDLLVIHNISLPPGQFGGPWIEALFTNRLAAADHDYFAAIHQFRVSAHVLIQRTGQIIQFVSFNQRAWHAGQSSFNGRSRCNDFSIGIELEGTDEIAYTDSQYEVLAQLSGRILEHYPAITPDRIVGHCDIAPGRKTDPGPVFDWQRFYLALKTRQN